MQKLEQRSYGELVQRVREQQATLKLTAASAHRSGPETFGGVGSDVQWQTTLDNLVSSSSDRTRDHSDLVQHSQLGEYFSRHHGAEPAMSCRSQSGLAIVLVQGQVTVPLLWRIGPARALDGI